MKLNFSVFKKGKTLYWLIGAVAIFVVFYFISSRGASASSGGGGITTINSGPSDAQIAASSAMQQTAIMANAQIATANLAAQAQALEYSTALEAVKLGAATDMASIQAGADVATKIAGYEYQATLANLEAQQNVIALQGEYSLGTAKVAAQSALDMETLRASMFNNQLRSNSEMFAAQMSGLVTQSALSQIDKVNKNDRDDLLALIYAGSQGTALTYIDPSVHIVTGPKLPSSAIK